MGRAVEGREEKRPRLSDLRESGSIENDSDSVVFLYQKSEFDPMELIIAKHRNGPTGSVDVKFDKETMKFTSVQSRKIDLRNND